MQSVHDAKILAVRIPDVPKGATFKHHPIVRKPTFYMPDQLADSGISNTAWVKFFEQILCGLHWKLGGPVPYAFRTYDGVFRKLDAGCLKFLHNREPQEVEFKPDSDGYIDLVIPTPALLSRHIDDKDILVAQLEAPS